jgi:hypothetical protein
MEKPAPVVEAGSSHSNVAIVLLICIIFFGLIVLCAFLIFASIALAYIAYVGELVVRRQSIQKVHFLH